MSKRHKKKRNGVMKKNIIILVLSLAIITISALTTGFAYAKLVKTAYGTTETATVARFGVTLTWGSEGLFSDNYTTAGGKTSVQMQDSAKGIAPGTSGSTTLTVGGESEISISLKIGVQATHTGWTLTDGTEYMPIVFVIMKGDKYLQADYTYATTKHTFAMSDMQNANIEMDTILAGTTLDQEYSIGWEWAATASVPSDTYYICTTADSDYKVGDIIGAETYNYILTDEQFENFEALTSTDEIDSYICSKSTLPTLSVGLKAIAEQLI